MITILLSNCLTFFWMGRNQRIIIIIQQTPPLLSTNLQYAKSRLVGCESNETIKCVWRRRHSVKKLFRIFEMIQKEFRIESLSWLNFFAGVNLAKKNTVNLPWCVSLEPPFWFHYGTLLLFLCCMDSFDRQTNTTRPLKGMYLERNSEDNDVEYLCCLFVWMMMYEAWMLYVYRCWLRNESLHAWSMKKRAMHGCLQ